MVNGGIKVTELEELKREFGEECLKANRIINKGEDDQASQLIYLGIVGTELIGRAFEAGKHDLANEILESPTLGGHK